MQRSCRRRGESYPNRILLIPSHVKSFVVIADYAPLRADEIIFDLGVNARSIAADPVEALREFSRRHLSGADTQRRQEVVMALAFRAAVGTFDAPLFIRHWKAPGT